jgi:hypothetical protein
MRASPVPLRGNEALRLQVTPLLLCLRRRDQGPYGPQLTLRALTLCLGALSGLQPFQRSRNNPNAGGDYCEGHQEHDGHAIHRGP